MSLEKPSFRDNLEGIKEAYPDKEMLNVSEVSRYLGKDRRVVKKRFNFTDNYIAVRKLAREMS